MSKEFGWYKVFILSKEENNTHVAPRVNANKSPLSSSIAFQTSSMVNAPNSAGINFTQNTALPRKIMIEENHEVAGGTER